MEAQQTKHSIESIQHDLLSMRPEMFASARIMECIPFIFKDDEEGYLNWKHELAEKLGVDPREIMVTGSACIGYSLNPNKDFKQFDERSDIDVGIVSAHYFDVAWYDIRKIAAPAQSNSDMDESILKHKRYYIFEGSIATDLILPRLSFGREWNDVVSSFRTRAPFNGRQINFRIYKDSQAFREYQVSSITKARNKLLEMEEIDAAISQ